MRTRSKLVALGAGVLVAAGIATTTTVASASSTDDKHCYVRVDTGTVACADTQADARAKISTASNKLIKGARFWSGKNYKGSTLTLLVPRKCSKGYDKEGKRFKFFTLGPFNEVASSVKTYNRCDVKLFDKTNFRGKSSTWIDSRANLGTVGKGWNNRASSVRLS